MDDDLPRRNFLQLSLRAVFAMVTVSAIVMAWYFARERKDELNGRFQLQVYKEYSDGPARLILLDTQTGHCWTFDKYKGKWSEYSDPVGID